MAIPVARLEQLTSNKTLKEFRKASKMRAVCSNSHQAEFDRGANKVVIDVWTDAASSGADPTSGNTVEEPTMNIKLTDVSSRDDNWPTPRKPGIRQVEMELKATSLQSNTINWLDERTVPLPAVETMRRHQNVAIRRDADDDIYAELIKSVGNANQYTNAELGHANGPLYDISDGGIVINTTNTLDEFGKTIDDFFDMYVEAMTDLGAMDGDTGSAGEEFYAHMNIRTWHLYQQYLESKTHLPEGTMREMLTRDTFLGAGMAVFVRKGIKIIINRQVGFGTAAGVFPLITVHGRSAVEVADIPGVVSLFSPRTNPTGPHWRLNQAAALAVKKVDNRTVRQLTATAQK